MKWIVDAKAFEYDKHYSDCKKENRPFIKARINRETGILGILGYGNVQLQTI